MFLLVGIFRKNRVITCLFGGFMWIAMSFNDIISDRAQYARMYADPTNPQYHEEWGYVQLEKLGNQLHISFQSFFAILLAIAILLVLRTVLLYAKNPGWVLALYFVFPLIIDGAQVRSFLAMSLIITGIPLLTKKNLPSTLLFIVCVSLASLLHYSAMFFFLLLITLVLNKVLMFVVCGISGAALYFNIQPLMVKAKEWFPFLAFKINRYLKEENFTPSDEMKGYAIYIGLIILFSLIAYLLFVLAKRNQPITELDSRASRNMTVQNFDLIFSDLVIKSNFLLFILLPLLTLSVSYDRIIRPLLLINYMLWTNSLSTKKYWWIKIPFAILMIGFVFYYCWFYIGNRFPEHVLYPFFDSNKIFP